jgi:hypothetical protein
MKTKNILNKIAIILSILALMWGAKFAADDYIGSKTTLHAVFTKDFQSYVSKKYNVLIDETIKEKSDSFTSDEEIRSVLSENMQLSEYFTNGIHPAENDPLTKYRMENKDKVYEIKKTNPPFINTISLGVAFGIVTGVIVFYGIHAVYGVFYWLINRVKGIK